MSVKKCPSCATEALGAICPSCGMLLEEQNEDGVTVGDQALMESSEQESSAQSSQKQQA